MLMRMTVVDSIKTVIPNTKNAKEFMGLVEECTQTADKSLARTLMSMMATMRLDGLHLVHEHVIEMTNIIARLKTFGIRTSLYNLFLTHYRLIMVCFK